MVYLSQLGSDIVCVVLSEFFVRRAFGRMLACREDSGIPYLHKSAFWFVWNMSIGELLCDENIQKTKRYSSILPIDGLEDEFSSLFSAGSGYSARCQVHISGGRTPVDPETARL